jgi:hypothetical protein
MKASINTHNLSKQVSVPCLACLVCLSCSMPAPQTPDDPTRALGLAVCKLFFYCKSENLRYVFGVSLGLDHQMGICFDVQYKFYQYFLYMRK